MLIFTNRHIFRHFLHRVKFDPLLGLLHWNRNIDICSVEVVLSLRLKGSFLVVLFELSWFADLMR
jgi:hypothetical protein